MQKKALAMFLTIAAMIPAAAPGRAQSLMTHHVRQESINGKARLVGRLSRDTVLQLDVVLPVRDRAGVQALIKELYNQESPNFRHFVTPAEFTERFGPTRETYDATVAYLKSRGFEIVGGDRDRRDVQVKGSVATIEAAFHLQMLTYRHPTEDRTFRGPDREPTVDLPFPLWHISGLDDYSIPKPRLVKRSDYARAHGIDPDKVVTHATTGSGPSASFLGSDMRAAYYGNGSLTGHGQTVGLFQFAGTDLTDLQTYYTNAGQTLPITPTLVSVDGTSTSCEFASGCDDGEQNLDMTQALGMAPGLANLVMFIGTTDTAIISAMTTHNPLPLSIGCSWGWQPADPTTIDPYFEQMATQGQTFLVASGDNATWKKTIDAWPADDANVTGVGGTDLTTSGAGGSWSGETAWLDSGSGITPDSIAIPDYQKFTGVINSSNHGSKTLRNGPDVAANADFTFYTCGNQQACQANQNGGTSFAAPMWAGYIALLNEKRANNGDGGIGFLNPSLYAIGLSSKYLANFHDITSGTAGSNSAMAGFDLVTGWGSMNGVRLLNTLASATSSAGGFALFTSDKTITAGETGSVTVTEEVAGGFNSPVTFSTTGKPASMTSLFSPDSLSGAGTTTLTFSTVRTTPPGTYTITIQGTPSSGIAETSAFRLTVAPPDYSLSATDVNVTKANTCITATSDVTESVMNGFATPVTLSATGKPNAVTASFVPPTLSGAGSSTLTFTVCRTAPPGTYPISVHGTTAAGDHVITTLNLTINP